MVGGVFVCLMWAHRHPTHPFFVLLFCLLVLWGAGLWGLWGVVDVGDEFVLVLTITAAHVRFLCVAWTL